ncbi:bola protein [Podospora didyma]|uniref:Bola protein n=1 Tax=Podospora didyma TaxID=330526 RepID=A0AAE0K204_9PEZI|nr:bola protein [Podospora didyma]
MICRTCLQASRAGLRAEASRPSQRLLQSTRPQSLPSTALQTRPLSLLQATLPKCSLPVLQPRLFSTSASFLVADQAQAAPELEKPKALTDGESQVWDRLMAEFAPTQLVVQDISGGCGSMYGIEVSSEKFRGLNMLKQQRLVNTSLADLMKEWHGVQLKTRVP